MDIQQKTIFKFHFENTLEGVTRTFDFSIEAETESLARGTLGIILMSIRKELL